MEKTIQYRFHDRVVGGEENITFFPNGIVMVKKTTVSVT